MGYINIQIGKKERIVLSTDMIIYAETIYKNSLYFYMPAMNTLKIKL